MSSAVTGKGVPVKVPNRSGRLCVLRFVRMAVAFVVVAGSLGLATVAATAQSGGGSCPSDGVPAYSDVPESSFAYDDSRCLRELGISDAGDPYRPGDDMTRSEMAAFMANAYAELTGMEAPIEEHAFTDIADDPNADDIARISPNGLMITTGTSDTTYSPNDPVIRGHMALFLTRLYKAVSGSDAPAGATPFTDAAERSDAQADAIGRLYNLVDTNGTRVTTGTSSTTFSPSDNVTREEMASFVARMYRVLNDMADAPAAPTGVTVAVSGDEGDSLDVSWDASEGADSYVVQWKSGSGDYSAHNQRSVDGTSTNFDGLTKGTSYTFRVAAVSDAGMSDYSDEASASPGTAPGAVGNLKVAPGNKTLSVTWDAPDDGGSPITGYTIRWVSTLLDRTQDEAETDGDALGYTITLKNNEGSYSVTVIPMNAVGVGEPSTVAPGTSTTPTTVASSAPTNLRAVQNDAGTLVTVSWTAPTDTGGLDIVNYQISSRTIDRVTGVTSAWTPPVDVPLPDPLTATISAPISTTPGDTLKFRVRADNTADDNDPDTGLGEWATGSIVPTTVPGAPTLVAEDVIPAHNSLQVSWTPNASDGGSALTGYKLSYSSGGAATEISVVADVTTYLITGLNNAYTYEVSVKAVNAKGDSSASGPQKGSPNPVPGAPSGVRAVVPPQFEADGMTPDNDGQSLVVTWNAPADNGTAALPGGGPVTNYVVSYRTSAIPGPVSAADCYTSNADIPAGMTCDAGSWTGYTAVGTNTDRKIPIKPLTAGTKYDVSVQSQNTAGLGPRTIVSGTPANIPAEVDNFELEPGYRLLTVSWTPAVDNGSDVTRYELRYAETSQPWRAVNIDAARNVHVISGLKPDALYDVQIRAVNVIGAGPWSDSNNGTDGTQPHSGSTSGVPSAPSNVRAVPEKGGSGDRLTISWNKVTASNGGGVLIGYMVQYRQTTADDWSWTEADLTNACDDRATTGTTEECDENTTSVTVDVDGTAGTTFLVRVRAITANGIEGSSGYAAPVNAAAVPAAPTGQKAEYVAATKVVNVTWTGLTGDAAKTVTSYKIDWYPSAAGAPGSIGSATVSDNTADSYTIRDLASGAYIVRIKAVNAIGESTAALTSTVTVP